MTPGSRRRESTRSGWPGSTAGVLGKQDNCQVAVSIPLANDILSVPAAYRLYLPELWAQDRARRRVARVPDEIKFRKEMADRARRDRSPVG